MCEIYDVLISIRNIIVKFIKQYKQNKTDKNIIDFTDIEHFALNILVKKNETGEYVPTDVAKKYQKKFVEIAIDEYQDSNLVQEYILKTISNGKNMFMVGDVKQSIYKFRQARPELFLEKYNSYSLAKDDNKECIDNTNIQLFKNFRSRENILNITNYIFSNIMTKKLGDIDYTEKEYLNLGMEYPIFESENYAGDNELHIINLENNEEDTEDEIILENTEIEAKFVANKMKEIIDSNYYIYDKKIGYRKATYKDFAILLRTTSNIASIYEKELNNLEIPVFNDVSQSYFDSDEIETIIALLKIIDNPNSDIPLVTVLRSIFEFSDNELLEIRLENKSGSFFDAISNYKKEAKNLLVKKINCFFDKLNEWQQKEEFLALDEFIWYLYQSTGFYDFVNSMPNGDLKIANLKLLFEKAKDYEKASFKGLYNFINYIERIKKSSGDTSSAKLIGENENVVKIMSIHKSKGLEFPIVFLSGTGKQFNMQDLNQNILLHQDIGFGPKVINYDRKIEYSTLAREAIKIKIKNETLSEEMRILYVALTRAKEKLIITGIEKDYEKSMQWKFDNIDSDTTINKSIVAKGKSYLDWLEMIGIKDNNNLLKVIVHNKSQIKNIKEQIKNSEVLSNKTLVRNKEIDEILNWKYPYESITNIEGKTSVSKLSHKIQECMEINSKPKFIASQKITGAEKGTLLHLVLQKINFKEEYDLNKIEALIEELVSKKIIKKDDANNIDKNKILNFTKSKLFKRVSNAIYIYKEQPFYINVEADADKNEKILVQGIIDLYFIEENGNIVLVDYKTDFVEENEEVLITKYKKQLELYKSAIEKSLNQKVNEAYIYSIYLNKELKI